RRRPRPLHLRGGGRDARPAGHRTTAVRTFVIGPPSLIEQRGAKLPPSSGEHSTPPPDAVYGATRSRPSGRGITAVAPLSRADQERQRAHRDGEGRGQGARGAGAPGHERR